MWAPPHSEAENHEGGIYIYVVSMISGRRRMESRKNCWCGESGGSKGKDNFLSKGVELDFFFIEGHA